jgi:prepilin-type N-terminal cleavage/methylation domain-containing protein
MRSSPDVPCAGGRRGFTLAELTVALGVLGVVLLLVTQVAYLVLRERQRTGAREEALEAAANVLEAARACPWEELTPAWAARQRLADVSAGQLPDGRLDVRVEPEPAHRLTRRVTVEVRWSDGDGPERSVRLVGLRSARSAAAGGGQP